MKLPYGQSNFKNVATEFYYVDRTQYIEKLENYGSRFLFFLRPRKFGKSLFVSMLGHYYSEHWKSEFNNLFGKYYIGQHPTPLANKFLVLDFDFSGILTDTREALFHSFTVAIKTKIQRFISTYNKYFKEDDRKTISESQSPDEALRNLFELLQRAVPEKKVYILIDEYDHFANELIAFHLEKFREIVSRNGFVRKFFEVLKEETKNGVVERMFVTGVSPITVDSLTSGFNIGEKVSLDLPLHDMMGFTEQETKGMLSHIGVQESEIPKLLTSLQNWYNGYLFNADAPNRLYNPNMLIYFCNFYQRNQKHPDKMLDENIASDYGKIRRMISVGGEGKGHGILEEVLARGSTRAILTPQFSFDRNWVHDDHVSLLFYLGMLTINGKIGASLHFAAPNAVIKELYYGYFLESLRRRTKLKETLYDEAGDAMIALYMDNDLPPFIQVVEKVLGRLSVRDARNFTEGHLKAIFAALLVSSKAYLVRSEPETGSGFVDLLCTHLPSLEINWNLAFELKYLKKKDAAELKNKKAEARQQLEGYLASDDLRHVPKLAAYAIVVVGKKVESVEQVK